MRLALTLLATTALLLSTQAQVPGYVPTDGLIGWWPFSGNADDLSGNDNNGTVNGATLANDRFGNPDGAYSFDGNNDYIDIVSTTGLSSSQGISMSLWFNWNGANGVDPKQFLFLIANNPNGAITISDSGQLVINVTNCNCEDDLDVETIISPNSWNHVVLTYELSQGLMKMYLNGVLIDSSQESMFTYYTTNNPADRFGNYHFNSFYFNGQLDDAGLWNRPLTQEEVSALNSGQGQVPCVSSTAVSYTGLDANYLTSDAPSSLSGTPTGGVFIGPGVTGDTFDPSQAGIGTHSIMYVYVDEGNCVNSAGLCTTVDQGVGIGGASNMTDGGVRVYPNPNNGQFSVELELTGLVSLQVFDARGRVVRTEVFQAIGARTVRTLDLSSEAKGAYVLQVQNNGGIVSQTLVIE